MQIKTKNRNIPSSSEEEEGNMKIANKRWHIMLCYSEALKTYFIMHLLKCYMEFKSLPRRKICFKNV